MPRLSSHFNIQDSRFSGPVVQLFNTQTISTAGAVTYTTDQCLSGLILRDTNGGARTDTTPTAAALVDAVQGAMVGHGFILIIRNTATAANSLTLAGGTGVTLSPTSQVVAQSNTKQFLFIFTNVTIGSEAVTVYSLGTATT